MAEYNVDDLIYLMQRLRDPESGCPWDLKQDFASIAPYTSARLLDLHSSLQNRASA